MNTMCKFCGSHGTDILRTLELKVTPPNQFNDPFEFTPRIYCSDSNSYAQRLFTNEVHLQKLYQMLKSDGQIDMPFKDFPAFVQSRLHILVQMAPEILQISLPDTERDFLENVSKIMGVLCMAERRDSILMWGHYCDKPRGLVIGFLQRRSRISN